ncbi:MAG: LCP family protein [Lachnospiraceae bacterium]
MENKKKTLRIISLITMILMALCIVIFAIVLINFNVFPPVYIAIAIIVLILIFEVVFFLRKKSTVPGIISIVVSLIMSIILAISSYYIFATDKTLKTITDEGYDILVYKVVVMADDKAESIADAAGYKFGTISSFEKSDFSDAIVLLNEAAQTEVSRTDYDGIGAMMEDFYDGKVQALFYEGALGGILGDMNENYYLDTKIIGEITIKKAAEAGTLPGGVAEAETKEPEEETPIAAEEIVIEPFVVLISGSDEYFDVSVTGRCDVSMLAVVNFETRQILLVSIPRDYYVKFPHITGDDRDKLTHAGIYGIHIHTMTLEELFDIDIDYYIRVNFTSVVDIINVIGGITIYNPYAFSTTYYDLYYGEGEMWLDGWESLQYARERKSLPDGDISRGEHQQIIIEAMVDKLVSISSIANYTKFLDVINRCAITNMSESFIKSVAKKQLDEGGGWEIVKSQAMGTSASMPSYAAGGEELFVIVPDEDSVRQTAELIKRVLAGEIVDSQVSAEGTATDEDS